MTATAPKREGRTGRRVELARYSVTAGDRVLYGQRVDGVVRVADVPLSAVWALKPAMNRDCISALARTTAAPKWLLTNER
jgi:hypothetical protein